MQTKKQEYTKNRRIHKLDNKHGCDHNGRRKYITLLCPYEEWIFIWINTYFDRRNIILLYRDANCKVLTLYWQTQI